MRALPLVLSLALVLAGCNVGIGTETVRGSGTATEEVREIRGGFNEVAISIPASLTIVQGKEPSLRLEGDDNLLPLIEVERDGRQLEIEADGVNLQPQTPLRVYVTVEELEGIRLAGSGDVEAAGLRTPRLEVSVAGSGDVRLPDLVTEVFEVEVAGSGDVMASGRAARQAFSLAGSGDVDAENLEGETAEVRIAGSGGATVNVRERIEASIMGSGSVRYRGAPEIDRSVMGSGEVEPIRGGGRG